MTPEEKNSYIKRRDGIVEVLDSLIGHWGLAEGLSALVGSSYVTPDLIDGIENILKESIQAVKDDAVRAKIQAGLDRITAIKERESQERTSEQMLLDEELLTKFIV